MEKLIKQTLDLTPKKIIIAITGDLLKEEWV
jgi:hypothetical protein